MNWKIENKLKRIFGVFKRSKSQIFPEDIEALKFVSETLAEVGKSNVQDNVLFAKLLCYVLNQNLHHHGSMKQSISEVGSVFKKPLNHHISILAINLNNQILNNYLKDLGIDFNYHSSHLDAGTINYHQNNIIEKIKSEYTTDKVEKSFVKTVNEFLTDIDNYV